MPRFFVGSEQIRDGWVEIGGEDALHIARSLRMAAGEEIVVCDEGKREYRCVLREFSEKTVRAQVLSEQASAAEPPFEARLYQALPKGDKLDTVIQKAVEYGVSAVIPFESTNCVVRCKDAAEARKRERRSRIAAEAAKQCGRAVIPAVEEPLRFAAMLEDAKASCDLILFCYEGEGTAPLGAVLTPYLAGLPAGSVPRIGIVVGSEGGFTPAEAQAAAEHGCAMVGLGARILRTESASGFVLSCLVFATELGG